MIIIIIILLILIILSSKSWNNPESAVQIISKLVATELEPSHRVIVVIANIISVITSALSVIIIIHTSAIPIIDIIIASKQLCMKPPIHPHNQHKGRIDTATKGKKRYPLVTPPNIHLIWSS